MAPGVPRLRKAVTEDNQGPHTLLSHMHTNPVRFDDAVLHLGHRGLHLAVIAATALGDRSRCLESGSRAPWKLGRKPEVFRLHRLLQRVGVDRQLAQALAGCRKDRVGDGGGNGRGPGLAHPARRLEALDDVDLDGRRLIHA